MLFDEQDTEDANQPLSYDSEQYDRRFLDCWRRQAVVFLKQQGADVDLLFYNCLPSTDEIFNEHILQHKPKYDFATPILNNESLSLLGWQQHLKTYDSFDMAEGEILEHLERVPFVIVMGSVFYFPHCPEYRAEHLNHSIVLTRPGADSVWQMVDDDPASELRQYDYHQNYIERYFDNNGSRLVRYFHPDEVAPQNAHEMAINKCNAYFSSLKDSYKLLNEIEWIANNPYESVIVRAKKIHEAFSIYSGSRNLFSGFAERVLHDQLSASHFKEVANEAVVIKYAMAKAVITGRINVGTLISRCEKLLKLERHAISLLRDNLGCS